MSLGTRIKDARERIGISQRALAEKINMTNGAVSRWESDKAVPNSEAIGKISRVLGVSTEWLLTETDKKSFQQYQELSKKAVHELEQDVWNSFDLNSLDPESRADVELGISMALVEEPHRFFRAEDMPAVMKFIEQSIPNGALKSKSSETVSVPVYGSIAAGTPIEELYQAEVSAEIPADIYSRHPHSFLLRVHGESMNKILPNGSLALIDPTEEFISGAMSAIYVNGYEATIKRVYKYTFGLVLHPESFDASFEDLAYSYEEYGEKYINYIGKVVWWVGDYQASESL